MTATSPLAGRQEHGAVETARAVLDVVIPVFNEQDVLRASVERVRAQLASLPWSYCVTIADNASTDDTLAIADAIAQEHDDVRVVALVDKGRGRALKRAWSTSEAAVLVYMDVDLSTDLNALLPLVAPLVSGHSDLAIGTRLQPSARVSRGPKRELISRGYNLIIKGALHTRFSDAQCGFKAIRADVAGALLPLVEDDAWFFDTELLVLAERSGLRIHEVPVDWIDDPDSKVDIAKTAKDDLRGLVRVGTGLLSGRVPVREVGERLGRARESAGRGRLGTQLVMFGLIGLSSTAAYAVLYLVLRGLVSAMLANLLALLITAIGNTAANRRLTFGISGTQRRGIHQLQGLIVFGVGLVVTSGSLWALHASGDTSHHAEVIVLTIANLAVTVMRFLAMRLWIFARRD